MKNKVLAVVVTYNRLEWLKRCVVALGKQTYEDFDIVIVNNGSNDGTKEWLDSISGGRIKVIHQDNLGGAGGFYTGQKYGMENGYEWLWLMDDDGIPENTQLEILLSSAEKVNARIISPLILFIDNPELEAFCPERRERLAPGTITDDQSYVCPFNGILYNREPIEKVGLIQKELFIWGDEREYHNRLMRAGYKPYTAIDAIHYHPMCKSSYDVAFPGLSFKIILKPEKLSKYFYRNNGYIHRLYNQPLVALREMGMYMIYFTRKLRFKELIKFVRWYIKGYTAKYPVRFAKCTEE